MTRLSTLAALALTSALLTPFVVEAAGGIRAVERPAHVQAATPAKAEAAAPALEPAPEACAKRVKVVYGAGTGCAPTPENRV